MAHIHRIEIQDDEESGKVLIRINTVDEYGVETRDFSAESPAVAVAARGALGVLSCTEEGRGQIRQDGREVALEMAKDLLVIASTDHDGI